MIDPSARLMQLRQMQKDDPSDAFIAYGVAMELSRLGNAAEAIAAYQQLLRDHPDYAAAYFMCGRTLEQTGQTDAAADMYRTGVATAQRAGDTHAAGEMQAALDALTP